MQYVIQWQTSLENCYNQADICALMSSLLTCARVCAYNHQGGTWINDMQAMATGGDVVDLCGVRQLCSGLTDYCRDTHICIKDMFTVTNKFFQTL